MQNLLWNELEQTAKIGVLENTRICQKKDYWSLLKSEQSIAELCRSKDNNGDTEETKRIFNELRNNFSKK